MKPDFAKKLFKISKEMRKNNLNKTASVVARIAGEAEDLWTELNDPEYNPYDSMTKEQAGKEFFVNRIGFIQEKYSLIKSRWELFKQKYDIVHDYELNSTLTPKMDELLDLLAKYIQKGKEIIGVIDDKAKQASRKRVSAYGYGADSNVVDDLIKIGDLIYEIHMSKNQKTPSKHYGQKEYATYLVDAFGEKFKEIMDIGSDVDEKMKDVFETLSDIIDMKKNED